jgi:hypothetical protein
MDMDASVSSEQASNVNNLNVHKALPKRPEYEDAVSEQSSNSGKQEGKEPSVAREQQDNGKSRTGGNKPKETRKEHLDESEMSHNQFPPYSVPVETRGIYGHEHVDDGAQIDRDTKFRPDYPRLAAAGRSNSWKEDSSSSSRSYDARPAKVEQTSTWKDWGIHWRTKAQTLKDDMSMLREEKHAFAQENKSLVAQNQRLLEDLDRQKRVTTQIQSKLNKLQDVGLQKVDRFSPEFDSDIEKKYNIILSKLDTIARVQLSKAQPSIAGQDWRDKVFQNSFDDTYDPTSSLFQKSISKSLRRLLLFGVLWKFLQDQLFSSPFTCFGEQGDEVDAVWNKLYPSPCKSWKQLRLLFGYLLIEQ